MRPSILKHDTPAARSAGRWSGRARSFIENGKALGRVALDRRAVAQGVRGAGHFERIAAGIGAFAAVAAAAERLRREQAQAAVGVAQRPVDEHLRLDAAGRRDVADFLERQLAGQHDAGEAEPGQRLRPRPVVDRQLRAGVQFQLREVRAEDVIDAEVLEDDRIDADVGEGGEGFDQFGQLILANQRVDGDEDAAARRQAVSVGRDLGAARRG